MLEMLIKRLLDVKEANKRMRATRGDPFRDSDKVDDAELQLRLSRRRVQDIQGEDPLLEALKSQGALKTKEAASIPGLRLVPKVPRD